MGTPTKELKQEEEFINNSISICINSKNVNSLMNAEHKVERMLIVYFNPITN